MTTNTNKQPAREPPRRAATLADPRWERVLARDPEADGAFVYAVQTTGVYCRPSSGSRLPRPDNVLFFATAEAAEAAGYRPSERAASDRTAVAEHHARVVADACRRIEEAEEIPLLDELAAHARMSPAHFHRVFRAETGLTPRAYAAAERRRRVREHLADRSSTVTEAIYQAGFGSSGRFYEVSNAALGMRPDAYRAGGLGAEIRFAVGQCSLGAILVAESERGICAIALGEDPDRLVRGLQDQFPRAELAGEDPDFERRVAEVVGLVEAPAIGLRLPLDIRGTAFQERVWQALRQIPPGATVSYTELAASIGAPTAARAVAHACAQNRLAVAIPCHRVVRKTGELSGYRWGVERKRALLEREAAQARPCPPAGSRKA